MLPFLDPENPCFPAPETALEKPNGLLAAGGNLAPETLLDAYSQGIFPWYEEGQPLLWWCPNPRAVLLPGRLHCSRSLTRALRQNLFTVRTDTAFNAVVTQCAAPRPKAAGTWITPAIRAAYSELHRLGHAHSVECWQKDALVGGLYGIALGAVFCGESMFSHRPNASKVAFAHLAQTLENAGFALIDCQIPTPHLASLGAEAMPRADFLRRLAQAKNRKIPWPKAEEFAMFK